MSFDPPPLPPQYGPLQVWWEAVRQSLKAELGGLETAVAALAAANAAQTTATVAQSTATTAQTTADAVTASDKLTASSVIPADCLTASDAGTDASIVIASHTRIYGDSSQLAVTGATITSLAYSTVYGIYYDDPTLADTTPTFVATTTLSHSLNNYIPGRHFVGSVETPASGGTASTGGAAPPGTGGDFHNRFDI